MIGFLAALLALALYGDEGARGCLWLLVGVFFILGIIGSLFN